MLQNAHIYFLIHFLINKQLKFIIFLVVFEFFFSYLSFLLLVEDYDQLNDSQYLYPS